MLLTNKQAITSVADAKNEKPDKWRVQKRWNNTHREARRAHALVAAALRAGTLKRGKCWCGSLKVEGHHHDYSKPLDVVWLCRRHHLALHAEQRKGGDA